jgi:hypothetical protein
MSQLQTDSLHILSASEIAQHQKDWTAQWHNAATPAETEVPWTHIESNHRMNFDLWHEEDIARRDDLGSERVHQAKRNIDKYNQARNDAMERIDVWVAQTLASSTPESATLHSETPGMIIDRLSILSLKSFHMAEEAVRESATDEHRERCAAKVRVLQEQLSDLQGCLDQLLAQIQRGERQFKLYKQFKMYNDASLNPQLYAKTQS